MYSRTIGGSVCFSMLLMFAQVAQAALTHCGNGVLESFEQCDDGNKVNADGCSSICQKEGDNFPVLVYSAENQPPTPELTDLPLLNSITQHGITWTFSQPARVGRFVNGDYYVVGSVSIAAISPIATTSNGRNGSMLNIKPGLEKSGFDNRLDAGRFDASLRVYAPVTLAPGNRLVSSRSLASLNQKSVMRPNDVSGSPVASVSILTSVSAPQPLDAFRPSYARNSNTIYFSHNLRRSLLPALTPVKNTPALSEFEAYLKRPWIDDVFFSFAVPAEYMASYGREYGYVMSFAGLLLTLNYSAAQKEPLLVYLTQLGIDLTGMVQAGYGGWPAHGGHGTGRKFPILLAGVMLNESAMLNLKAKFGEDMQTIYVSETLPTGTYSHSWHTPPETVVYGGHQGINGESTSPGWGPYEHLRPSQWASSLGETYRRCCTSVSWIGEALAARLIPGMQKAWAHPQFFEYADRWMTHPENPADIKAIMDAIQLDATGDFGQGQSAGILRGGGYDPGKSSFVDQMWAAYYSASSKPANPENLRINP